MNNPKGFIRRIGDFDDLFEETNLSQPEGLTFLPESNNFLLVESQSSTSTQLDAIALSEDDIDSQNLSVSIEPINTAFDPNFDRLLGIAPNDNDIIAIETNNSGDLNPNTQEEFDINSLGIDEAQGISVATDGTLYVLDGGAEEIVQVEPHTDGSLDGASAAAIDLPNTISNPRGIAVDPTTGHLHVLSPSQDILYELSPTGQVLDTRDVSQLGFQDPQALTFAPTRDSTDSPNRMSLYVTDNDPNSAGIHELSFSAPVTRAATANWTFIETFDTSGYPSSDPAGLAYDSTSDRLVITDSEINEIPSLFTGDNLYEITRSGNLTNAFGTTAYSREPTGITFNAGTNRFFISDDNDREITEVNAQYQEIREFDTTNFGSGDPEGVAYAANLGDLFIADGIDNEVYRVTPNGNLVSQFDTESLGITDPEGIVYDPQSGNLLIVGEPNDVIVEVTVTGNLVDTFDISAANAIEPAGLTIAPDPQNPSQRNLYIVDRGIDNNADPNENDGRVHVFVLDTIVADEADLSLSTTVSNGTVTEGNNVTFTLTLDNSGPENATNVEVTDALPAGFSFVSATESQGNYNSNTGVWDVGNINNNGTATLDVVATANTAGNFTYTAEVTASDLPDPDSTPGNGVPSEDDLDSVGIVVEPDNPASGDLIYVSSTTGGNLNGLRFRDEDILLFDSVTGTWSLHFDGSDVNLGGSGIDLRAFHINSDGSILMSFSNTVNLPGIGNVNAQDIVRFIPSSTGNNTAGTYEFYFDGSDVGLTNNNEKIDAIAFTPDGRLLVSTQGSAFVPGVSAADEDLLVFNPSSLGTATSGSWQRYFDGSDVGLTQNSEDIKGAWVDGNGDIYLTTLNNFNVPGASGDSSDIFTFTPNSTGVNTSGTFAPFWDGSANGFAGENIDGLFLDLA